MFGGFELVVKSRVLSSTVLDKGSYFFEYSTVHVPIMNICLQNNIEKDLNYLNTYNDICVS